MPIIKKLALSDSTIYIDKWKAYMGIVNSGYKKHYRVTHNKDAEPMLTELRTFGEL